MIDRHAALILRTFAVGALAGLLLALIISATIVGERLFPGDLRVVITANVIAAAAAMLVLLFTFRPFLTWFAADRRAMGRSIQRRRVVATIAAHSAGALVGVALIHLALRGTALPARPWLSERPPQLVNDLVAVFGALLLVWSSARRPFGALFGLGALAIALAYAITSHRWHLDALPPATIAASLRSSSVQLGVLGQLVCVALGTSIFRRRVAGDA